MPVAAFLELEPVEWGSLLGATFAAIAAGAAWRSAYLNQRAQLAASRPELAVEPLAFRGQQIHYNIYNEGGGLARGCGYAFVGEGQFVVGYLGPGTLRSGEMARVRTVMPPLSDKARGVAVCRDSAGNTWCWDLEDSPKRRLNTRRRSHRSGNLGVLEALKACYPTLDTTTMEQSQTDVIAEADLAERRFTRGSGSLADAAETYGELAAEEGQEDDS